MSQLNSQPSAVAKLQQRSIGKELQGWVQTTGIIIALCWGAYTFIYKEIYIPKSSPINLTINLQLQETGTYTATIGARNTAPLVAVSMKVTATNPSNRNIYLLPNFWYVVGKKVIISEQTQTFHTNANDLMKYLNYRDYLSVEKHAAYDSGALIALGNAFTDLVLRPNETVTRNIILHIPKKEYDSIEVRTVVPTVGQDNKVALEWKLTEDDEFQPTMYRLNPGKPRELMKRNESGGYDIDEALQLQMAVSVSELSLWH